MVYTVFEITGFEGDEGEESGYDWRRGDGVVAEGGD